MNKTHKKITQTIIICLMALSIISTIPVMSAQEGEVDFYDFHDSSVTGVITSSTNTTHHQYTRHGFSFTCDQYGYLDRVELNMSKYGYPSGEIYVSVVPVYYDNTPVITVNNPSINIVDFNEIPTSALDFETVTFYFNGSLVLAESMRYAVLVTVYTEFGDGSNFITWKGCNTAEDEDYMYFWMDSATEEWTSRDYTFPYYQLNGKVVGNQMDFDYFEDEDWFVVKTYINGYFSEDEQFFYSWQSQLNGDNVQDGSTCYPMSNTLFYIPTWTFPLGAQIVVWYDGPWMGDLTFATYGLLEGGNTYLFPENDNIAFYITDIKRDYTFLIGWTDDQYEPYPTQTSAPTASPSPVPSDTVYYWDMIQSIGLPLAIIFGLGILAYFFAGPWGFFAGINIGVIVCFVVLGTDYIPLWAVVVMIAVDALLLFGKIGLSKGDGGV